MARPYKCPYCGSSKSIAKGFRRNQGGKVRLRQCKGCRRRWTVGPSAEGGLAPESRTDHDAHERPEPETVTVSERPSTEQTDDVPQGQHEQPDERAIATQEEEPESV